MIDRLLGISIYNCVFMRSLLLISVIICWCWSQERPN